MIFIMRLFTFCLWNKDWIRLAPSQTLPETEIVYLRLTIHDLCEKPPSAVVLKAQSMNGHMTIPHIDSLCSIFAQIHLGESQHENNTLLFDFLQIQLIFFHWLHII